MTLDLNKYLDSDGLFVRAFEPLRESLDQQAQAAWNKKPPEFSPWLTRSGKGGDTQYINYYDVSLYRHCMDVTVIAVMAFFYAWQNERIPHPAGEMLKPDEDKIAELLLKQIVALAFLHDADKYWGAEHSSSPKRDQLEQLHDLLEVEKWASLDVETSFTLVSAMEKRGEGNALFTGLRPSLTHQKLIGMLKIGDKIASIASRKGLEAMIEDYNQKYLPELTDSFAVPADRLKLLTFRHSPVVLHELQYNFIKDFYSKQIFPLVCLLDGQQFYISVPENYDLTNVFQALEYKIAFKQPEMKRNPTNGEISLFHVHNAEDLKKAAERENNGPKLLVVHVDDWDEVSNYIKSWVGEVGDLSLLDKADVGKLLSTVTPENSSPSDEYKYALIVATALRANAKGQIFEQRVQNLINWDASLQNWADFKKDTRQTLLAMQAAMSIEDEDDLIKLIETIYGDFPPSIDKDEGTQAIIEQLKAQCGLSNETENSQTSYAPAAKGGTCLLCGYPTANQIKTSEMKLAGIKASAFNNRIGHQKNVFSSFGKNYICPACVKQQALLCQIQPKLKAEPLIVATPLRGLIKPLDTSVTEKYEPDENIINSFNAMSSKGWQRVLPWNLDVSQNFPFILESIDPGFDSAVDAMHRWAVFALHSGNPVHIFISSQRDCKASFLFEQTPPLIRKLLAVPQGGIRRNHLPQLVKRLELFKNILRTNYGHDVLTAMPRFGWWAVAWFQQISDKKNTQQIELAKKEYPMEKHSLTLENIAYLAAQIQRYPGADAGNSDKTFCLDIVLEQFDTSKRYPVDATTKIAGMAGELEKRFDSGRSRHAKNGDGGTFSERYHKFAQAVFEFVNLCEKEHRLDARFRRFLRAAYSHLFMEKSLAHTRKNKDIDIEKTATVQESLL
ncbi:hypothetical protein PN36_23355 [Candidatus Thiomargarita nelsonii]|uniref:CRISPR-associated protein Csc3 n=1 Tax=Candidatus Thiomargarita nelsonii TaxID=1003181 RepID=A0A0A6PFR5_9GAMM|nr:hypothetical protein PN36_23355 [Candidatus Thiomargarita nelsonii]